MLSLYGVLPFMVNPCIKLRSAGALPLVEKKLQLSKADRKVRLCEYWTILVISDSEWKTHVFAACHGYASNQLQGRSGSSSVDNLAWFPNLESISLHLEKREKLSGRTWVVFVLFRSRSTSVFTRGPEEIASALLLYFMGK